MQAYPELKLTGRVEEIGYSSGKAAEASATAFAGERVNTYLVRIALDPHSYDAQRYPLRPDMSAVVRIVYARRDSVLVAPLTAIVLRKGKEVLYLVENGLAREVPVRVGLADDQYIELVEGGQEGALIVTGPYEILQNQLRDSVAVRFTQRPIQ